MVFGLTCAPVDCQRLTHYWRFELTEYLILQDDILIVSQNFEDHLEVKSVK